MTRIHRRQREDRPDKPHTRFAWARLNADALLLSMLAMGAGIFGAFNPGGDDLIQEIGHVTPSHYLEMFIYFWGGFGILWALASENVTLEILSRAAVLFAVCFDTARVWLAFGWGDPYLNESFVVVGIVGLTMFLRVSALLSKKGIIVRIPERENSGYLSPEDDVKDGPTP